MNIIPNIFTLTNLLLGFLAILAIGSGRFSLGCWLIIAASLMDGADGAAARWTKRSSAFGREFDSLSDLISFGLAPAVLVVQVLYQTVGNWAIALAFMQVLSGAVRLARYNINASSSDHLKSGPLFKNTRNRHGARGFIGLPIPGAALVIVSFYLYTQDHPEGRLTIPIWVVLTLLVSLLMVSSIPYPRFPLFTHSRVLSSLMVITCLVVLLIALVFKNFQFLFPLSLIYLMSGPGEIVKNWLRPTYTSHSLPGHSTGAARRFSKFSRGRR